jgi:hypothetical protein
MRLVKINRDRILYSAFTTDQDLAQGNSKCWFSTLNKIFKILKLDIKNLADNSVFRNNLIEYFHQQSDSQLQKIQSGAVDSKLILFSNIFIPNFVPFHLETNLSKSIKSKITQLRISAHCLNIERGRYNKPKIPREERFCKFCTEVETEHLLISCHTYKDIKKTFSQSYGLNLKDSHNTYFLLSKLLNPKNIIECNYLYKFIRDALEIRNTS